MPFESAKVEQIFALSVKQYKNETGESSSILINNNNFENP